MGVARTSLVTPNDPLYEEANVLGVWRWVPMRNAYFYEQVSSYPGLSLKQLLFVSTIRFSLFITEYLPNNLTNF